MVWMGSQEKVRPVLDMFTRCTPGRISQISEVSVWSVVGATIEDKASAIVWHYRDCDEEYGQFKAKELMHQRLNTARLTYYNFILVLSLLCIYNYLLLRIWYILTSL